MGGQATCWCWESLRQSPVSLFKLSSGSSLESSVPTEFSFSSPEKSSNCPSEHVTLCPRVWLDGTIYISNDEGEHKPVNRGLAKRRTLGSRTLRMSLFISP